MGTLVDGDDGMLVEDVGTWAKEKHEYLRRYLDISRGVRAGFVKPGKAGATYIDLFCGTGRARVRWTGEYIDGSCVAAWKKSVAGGAPFSAVYVADADEERLNLAVKRLRALNAPVVAYHGRAIDTVKLIRRSLDPYGLHFAFVDPFNLGAFHFDIVNVLADLRRIDMLVHVSKMDMQRNLRMNLRNQQTMFDAFAPGWRDNIDVSQPDNAIRRMVFEYWQGLVAKTGMATSKEVDLKLITTDTGQHLYWLLLAAKHELAHKFWNIAAADREQPSLF